jgi:very-short-patch-repair endonuclease
MSQGRGVLAGMRTDIELAVARLAGRQYGVFSSTQARQCDATEALIHRRARSGLWERTAPAVYRLPGFPDCWLQRLMIAVLDAGDGAVVSHRAAARLWDLDGVRVHLVEITVPRARRRYRAAIVHETAPFTPDECTTVDGLPVTSPVMTLLQLGAVAPDDVVERAYESARRRHLVADDDLIALLDSRRAGASTLRRVLARRQPDDACTESELETRFVQLVRRAGLPDPRRQQTGDGYRIDFTWPGRRLAVELDGLGFHDGRLRQQHDRTRQNRVVIAGWRILRFTWDDVTRRPEAVVAALRRTLAA